MSPSQLSFQQQRRFRTLLDCMKTRLEIINSENLRRPAVVVARLRYLGLVSKYYNPVGASVDVWFVTKSRIPSNRSAADLLRVTDDPDRALLLAVVVDAINILQCDRPCDAGKWRIDIPPQGKSIKCTPNDHICAEQAEIYLRSLSEKTESALNLRAGYIKDLLRRRKERLRSRNC